MWSYWPESWIADAVFGSRQLLKHKTASAAAILSLALGIGSCLAAFRLIDALFLRPLPVAHPDQLYALTYDYLFEGKIDSGIEQFDYPELRQLGAAVQHQAQFIALGFPRRIDLTFGTDQEMERAYREYVSGSMFGAFGMRPALGRLLAESDDRVPGAHPVAVISYDYWSRRFANDPSVLGRHFRVGNDIFQIIGVAPKGFTGTDPGTFVDIFLPNMMNVPMINMPSTNGYRAWVRPKPGVTLGAIRGRLSAALHSYREELVKTWPPERSKQEKNYFVSAPISLEAAGTGRSGMQHGYQRPLAIFAVLVGLVLLIACANMANLMTGQAAARAREMALRVSIGAGRARLIQLVLIESAMIAAAAGAIGMAFSGWAAQFVVGRVNSPDQPVRLALSGDWRITVFALGLASVVALLFGLAPALRASAMQPALTLKGGDDPHRRRRLMNGLIAAQVAFCCFVLFISGLFIATFEKMANQSTGFSPERLLTLQSVSRAPLSPDDWYRTTQQLQSLPGVESAAVAQYALMSFNARTRFVWANGHSPDGTWSHSTWFLGVSPGWFRTMKLGLLEGRDLRWDDEFPQVAVVNETFVRRYFGGENPLGRSLEIRTEEKNGSPRVTVRIVGVARDARYEDMRLPIAATAYVPFRNVNGTAKNRRADPDPLALNHGTFLVRTKSPDPMSLASTLRRAVTNRDPEIRVDNIVSQQELVRSQMIRERLLAALAAFFAAVALLLAGIGLYGVLNYAVIERSRELGIRIALGATAGHVAARVTFAAAAMIALGAAAGLGVGRSAEPYIAGMLYQIRAGDPRMMALPLITLVAAAVLAAVPPVFRAIRLDPSALLRSD